MLSDIGGTNIKVWILWCRVPSPADHFGSFLAGLYEPICSTTGGTVLRWHTVSSRSMPYTELPGPKWGFSVAYDTYGTSSLVNLNWVDETYSRCCTGASQDLRPRTVWNMHPYRKGKQYSSQWILFQGQQVSTRKEEPTQWRILHLDSLWALSSENQHPALATRHTSEPLISF